MIGLAPVSHAVSQRGHAHAFCMVCSEITCQHNRLVPVTLAPLATLVAWVSHINEQPTLNRVCQPVLCLHP